jgi:hypothetical protein
MPLKYTRRERNSGQKDRCQCDPTCNKPPINNQPFCATHIRRCTRTSPLSGWEPDYIPAIYNNNKTIRESHNCFAYAFGVYDPPPPQLCDQSGNCNVKFHQPGNFAGYQGFSGNRKKRCPDIIARVLGDNPNARIVGFEDKCPRGTSKVAFAVDPQNDYHVWRQDSNSYWSDKHGSHPVSNIDASGRLQYDPALSNRNYPYSPPLNYKDFCGYVCVPRGVPVRTARSLGGSRSRRRSRKRKHLTYK